jgi:hypothetical protein
MEMKQYLIAAGASIAIAMGITIATGQIEQNANNTMLCQNQTCDLPDTVQQKTPTEQNNGVEIFTQIGIEAEKCANNEVSNFKNKGITVSIAEYNKIVSNCAQQIMMIKALSMPKN